MEKEKRHKTGKVSDNKTGFKGVRKLFNKYGAYVTFNYKEKTCTKYLGNFTTPEEAYKRRCDYLDSLK